MSAGDPADPRWFRQVLGQYPTGVCVVTARKPTGEHVGMVVGSFTLGVPRPAPDRVPSRTSDRARGSGSSRPVRSASTSSAPTRRTCVGASPRASRTSSPESSSARPSSGSAVMSGASPGSTATSSSCTKPVTTTSSWDASAPSTSRTRRCRCCSSKAATDASRRCRWRPATLRGLLTEQPSRRSTWSDPEMERIVAEIPGARCTAVTMHDGELVYTATAGGLDAGTIGHAGGPTALVHAAAGRGVRRMDG